jgi:hypothetical protein
MKNIAKTFIFLTVLVSCLTTCDSPTNNNHKTSKAGTLFIYAGTSDSLEIANDSRGYTFPDTFLNESNEVSITIKNTGDGIIKLTGKPYINLDGATTVFSVSAPPEASAVNPGGSVSFKIKFTPLNAVESYVYVSIPNDSKNAPDFSFTIYGKGMRPKPVASVFYANNEIPQNGTINAGDVLLTQSKNITVIIKNTGIEVLTIETANITISGANKDAFKIIDLPAQSISVGSQSQLIIEWEPDRLGGYDATLRIPTNDSSRLQVEIYLQGQAVKGSPLLQLTQGTAIITNNSLTPFDFGRVPLDNSKSLTFTVKNTGNINLELNGTPVITSSSAAFTVLAQPANTIIQPGAFTEFTIGYTPASEGVDSGYLTILNNGGGAFILNIRGTGYIKKPQITIKQGSVTINQYGDYNFGNIAIGESSDAIFSIGNSGEANLKFITVNNNRINLADNNEGLFTVTYQPSASTEVAPENTTTFTIRFSPITTGTNFSAVVQIKTNSSENEDFYINLKGNGYEKKPQIVIKQDTTVINPNGEYIFGSLMLNNTKDLTFTISNNGEANLNFITVNGNCVNLENTTGSYFSVIQQPFAGTVVSPNSTASFIIRFKPTVVGNNFIAAIHIKTDSQNNNDFYFWVKGNGSNSYKIGDTGPGGGMIFYAEGGQYKECSGELGSYMWDSAITTAKNYRGGGFSNWYLPDDGELSLMYRNLHQKGLGGFSNGYYWSSTEEDSGRAYRFSFNSGSYGSYYKSYSLYVRAVRTFSL